MADEGHDHDSADLDYVVTFNPVASIEKVRTVTVTPAVHSVFVVCLVCLSFVGSVVRIACVVCALAPLRSCDTRIHMVALAAWAACCHAVHHHANMQVEGKGYSFRNTASSQLSDEFNLPCQTVDSSQGKGNMMVWGKADWDLGLTGRGGTQHNATQCQLHIPLSVLQLQRCAYVSRTVPIIIAQDFMLSICGCVMVYCVCAT